MATSWGNIARPYIKKQGVGMVFSGVVANICNANLGGRDERVELDIRPSGIGKGFL